MTPEREMEIRAYYAHEGEPPVSFYRPKEAGSAARYDMAEVLAALDAEREKAARLERERDTLAAKLDEREGDMHARIRAEYDRTIADAWRAANARMADERDTLAAALAEVRDAGRASLAAGQRQAERGADRLGHALSALPADLAAARDARVVAEALEGEAEPLAALVFERLCQLRFAPRTVDELAGVLGDALRARAAEKRGGR